LLRIFQNNHKNANEFITKQNTKSI